MTTPSEYPEPALNTGPYATIARLRAELDAARRERDAILAAYLRPSPRDDVTSDWRWAVRMPGGGLIPCGTRETGIRMIRQAAGLPPTPDHDAPESRDADAE